MRGQTPTLIQGDLSHVLALSLTSCVNYQMKSHTFLDVISSSGTMSR